MKPIQLVILLTALGISLAAGVLISMPDQQSDAGVVERPTATITLTETPTNTPPPTITPLPTTTPTVIPTVDPAFIATSAAQPLDSTSGAVVGVSENPFTINREGQRTELIEYVVQSGDTVDAITARYGVSLETLVWSNRRFFVNALRPGFVMTILPVDGAIHRVDTAMTIAEIATQYKVDPYAIIDSDFNDLKDSTPDNILPIGLEVIVPGGHGNKEPLYYEPPQSVYIEASGPFGETGIYQGSAVFGEGQPGSCGKQDVYGGTIPSIPPTGGYVLTNDFTSDHQGVDLADTLGAKVVASGGGTVIFAGWSTWGYGYAIVIAHGPVMSLYAHLSDVGVWCGQQVETGQYIGNVGSTGWSSGPHVHFEIRDSTGTRLNPHSYVGF